MVPPPSVSIEDITFSRSLAFYVDIFFKPSPKILKILLYFVYIDYLFI